MPLLSTSKLTCPRVGSGMSTHSTSKVSPTPTSMVSGALGPRPMRIAWGAPLILIIWSRPPARRLGALFGRKR